MNIIIESATNLEISDQEIGKFYSEYWNKKTILSDAKFIKWQFGDSLLDNLKNSCVVAYELDKKKILGVLGLTERHFYMSTSKLNGAELTNWMVLNEFSGHGIGNKMMKFVQDKYDVLMGMGITEVALNVYYANDYKFLREIPRFTRVFNSSKINPLAKITSLGEKLILINSKQNLIEFKIHQMNKEIIDKIFLDFTKDFNLYSRSSDVLNWRYNLHPFFKYKQFIISSPNSDKKIFVCLREEVCLAEVKILHVVDCFGDLEALSAAISFIDVYCIKNNIDFADFYCTTSKIYSYFINNGWLSTSNDKSFQFPHLFKPIEFRDPPTTSLVYWSKKDRIKLADVSSLYITKQDIDLDRPTI